MAFQSHFEFDQAVAAATGEDLLTIQRRGFSLVDPNNANFDPEPDLRPPQYVDWDDLELSRNTPLVDQPLNCLRRGYRDLHRQVG